MNCEEFIILGLSV